MKLVLLLTFWVGSALALSNIHLTSSYGRRRTYNRVQGDALVPDETIDSFFKAHPEYKDDSRPFTVVNGVKHYWVMMKGNPGNVNQQTTQKYIGNFMQQHFGTPAYFKLA